MFHSRVYVKSFHVIASHAETYFNLVGCRTPYFHKTFQCLIIISFFYIFTLKIVFLWGKISISMRHFLYLSQFEQETCKLI